MTVSVEELIVLLIVLGTGKPLIANVKNRILRAIEACEQRKVTTRNRNVRLRAYMIDIWID